MKEFFKKALIVTGLGAAATSVEGQVVGQKVLANTDKNTTEVKMNNENMASKGYDVGDRFISSNKTDISTSEVEKGTTVVLKENATSNKKIENIVESKGDVFDMLRRDWNDYVDWLEMKGLKGDEKLDRNGLGVEMITQYRIEHPETTVSNETVGNIQEEFAKYRTWVLDQIKQGKAAFAPGVTEETFMTNLSKSDHYAGQLTTMKKFPLAYLQLMKDNSLQSTKTVGYAKTENMFSKNK